VFGKCNTIIGLSILRNGLVLQLMIYLLIIRSIFV